ncbi:MAG: D-sedoheptulose 7-phosphate isomerase [Verrucomicrobiota bacterium]
MPSLSEQLEELELLTRTMQDHLPAVEQAAALILSALKNGNKVLACGNGGSASDAMHLVEELVGRYRADRVALPAIALVADPTVMSCIANDWGYQDVFSRQVEAHAQQGDVLVGFSTSGNSPSVVHALNAAKVRGVKTIGLLGKSGGTCHEVADLSIIVPHENTARIQEIHTWILHVFLETVEEGYTS